MPDTTPDGSYVSICDWHGRVIWVSGDDMIVKPGELAWQHLEEVSQDRVKNAFARVVSLREEALLEVTNELGVCLRSWLWPLDSPEFAVCALSIVIPKELTLLTNREREVLGFLALGHTTREIAKQLDVSASTVHTHLRKAREKLSLPSLESLTGFSARYCHPTSAPFVR